MLLNTNEYLSVVNDIKNQIIADFAAFEHLKREHLNSKTEHLNSNPEIYGSQHIQKYDTWGTQH